MGGANSIVNVFDVNSYNKFNEAKRKGMQSLNESFSSETK
jgi:hypothetical protein